MDEDVTAPILMTPPALVGDEPQRVESKDWESCKDSQPSPSSPQPSLSKIESTKNVMRGVASKAATTIWEMPAASKGVANKASNVTKATNDLLMQVAMTATGAVTEAATVSASNAYSAISNIPAATRNMVRKHNVFSLDEGLESVPLTEEPYLFARESNASTPKASTVGDFRQRLDFLLSTPETAKEVAHKLYPRFEGEVEKLEAVLKPLEQKWGLPAQVFPALYTQIRRAAGQPDLPQHITEENWAEAFLRWLQGVRATSTQTKVSRKCLVHARPGLYLQEEYLQGAKLGEGSFGEVHLMLHKALGVARVVKSVPKTQLGMAADHVEDEVNLLKSMDHPNIVRIFETFETDLALHIIMDYAEGGDLASVIRQSQKDEESLKMPWVRSVTGQIASALAYMHKRAVIHCDLKPANAMLLRPALQDETPHVLLADFGLAEIFQERPDQGAVKVKGTPSYLAPEGFEGHLTQKSDMWALGVILYELLLGKKPFVEHKNVFVLWSHIAKKQPVFDELPGCAHETVKALLNKDPKLRPSAQDCFTLEWFQNEEVRKNSVDRHMPVGHLNYFHRSVMFTIAAGLGMKDMRELYAIFRILDADNSGYLSLEELQKGLHLLGVSEDASTLLAIMDMDQNGYISYTEFMAAALQIDADLNENLIRYAFESFDLNGDGNISAHELQRMLSGDGPLVDVLPDGQTLDQVMNKLARGSGTISFEDFKTFLADSRARPAKTMEADFTNEPRFLKIDDINQVIDELDVDVPYESNENTPGATSAGVIQRKLPVFEKWLADMYEDTKQSTHIGRLLMFKEPRIEGLYVAHQLPRTCQRVASLGIVLFLISMSAVLYDDFEWFPVIHLWDNKVLVVYNCAHMLMMLSAVVIAVVCYVSGERRRKASLKVDDLGAAHFENWLCVWASVVPWVVCFFAERFRVSAFFDEEAMDTFPSTGRWKFYHYDLLLFIFSFFAYFVTLTNIRFAGVFFIGINSTFAYLISTICLNHARPGSHVIPIWPCLFLVLLVMLALAGSRALEYHRRLSFLSLYHSYVALSDLHAHVPDANELLSIPAAGHIASGDQWEQFKAALDLIQRFSENKELTSRPLRIALRRLKAVLETVRDDIAWANRWFSPDLREPIKAKTAPGLVQRSLLAVFDVEAHDLPAAPAVTTYTEEAVVGLRTVKLNGAAIEAWGWDTLSGQERPLFRACLDLLLPAVERLGASGSDVEHKGHACVEGILRAFPRASAAEARAALALRSARWLAEALGFWSALDPWEQFALLVSAAALHCSAAGGAFAHPSMLDRVTSANSLLGLLDKIDLVTDANTCAFRQLVCRILVRATPRKMLEDARFIRCQLNQCGRLAASDAERKVIISLIVAIADFSFLALPGGLHDPWAATCRAELAIATASKAQTKAEVLDVASWLHTLIELLMVPVYNTLSALEGAEENLVKPMTCLSENSKKWRSTKMVVDVEPPSHSLTNSNISAGSPGSARSVSPETTHLANPLLVESMRDPAEIAGSANPKSTALLRDMLPGQVDH